MSAIKAMKQALDALEELISISSVGHRFESRATNLHTAIAEMEKAEPVARMSDTGRAYTEADGPNWRNMPIPLYTHPQTILDLDALVRDAERYRKAQKIAEGIEYRHGLRGFFVPDDIRDLLVATKETK